MQVLIVQASLSEDSDTQASDLRSQAVSMLQLTKKGSCLHFAEQKYSP